MIGAHTMWLKKLLRVSTRMICMVLCGTLWVSSGGLLAQDPVFDLTIGLPAEVVYNSAAPEVASFSASIQLQETTTTNGGADPHAQLQGYSLGVGHDGALLEVTSAIVTTTGPSGESVDFDDVSLYADGFTFGVVYSFVGSWTLSYETATELGVAQYQLLAGPLTNAADSTVTSIAKSDSLGVPPVVSVVVINGASIPMNGVVADTQLIPFTPEFELSIHAPSTVYYPEATPEQETFTATVNLEELVLPGTAAEDLSQVQGYSFAVGHDASLMQINSISTVITSDTGLAPDFVQDDIYTDGVTSGVVFSFPGLWTLAFDNSLSLASIEYQLASGALTGASGSTSTSISFVGTLGSPVVENVVVVDGASISSSQVNANADLVPFTGSRFIRGDSTQDGTLDLADGIGVLSYLFAGGSATCMKALDLDGSNHVSISDGVQVLCAIFCAGSPPPSAPFPDCGVDLVSTLTCNSFGVCP